MNMHDQTKNAATLRVDLHLHTNHSFDCESRIAKVLEWAERKGIDAIALTDHDRTTAYREALKLKSSVRIIPGVEVTTDVGTHVLGYFITSDIQSSTLIDVIREIHDKGGICALPHPFRSDTGIMYNAETKGLHTHREVERALEEVDLLEALNSKCSTSDRLKTDTFISENADTPVIAGSDGHQEFEVGRAHLQLHDVQGTSDDSLKNALLHSSREIHWEPHVDASGANAAALGVIEGARSLFKSAKGMVPAPLWRRMRSVYMRSRGAALTSSESQRLSENQFTVYKPFMNSHEMTLGSSR